MNNPSLSDVPLDQPDAAFERNVAKCAKGQGYSLTVGKSPKFMWYRNAKVATRTTLSTLDQAGVVYQMRQEFCVDYTPDDLAAYLKFAFVRNPWDRLVSGWLNKVVNANQRKFKAFSGDKNNFEAFVSFLEDQDIARANIHFRLQTELLPLNKIDFLGRFENFDADLKEVLTRLKLKADIELEQKNSTKNRQSYQDYYTPALRERVARLYQPDIEVLEYEF